MNYIFNDAIAENLYIIRATGDPSLEQRSRRVKLGSAKNNIDARL